MAEMKQLCMYCGCYLGSMETSPGDTDSISHGLCMACLPRFLVSLGQPLSEFLDSLPGQIFILDKEGRVEGANTAALQSVSKDVLEVQGKLGGTVFECRHSREPGGCGRTLHCKACAIRNAVTKTFETGEACHRIPAFMDLGNITHDFTIRFLISTEKVGDHIFLRVDEVLPPDDTDAGDGVPPDGGKA